MGFVMEVEVVVEVEVELEVVVVVEVGLEVEVAVALQVAMVVIAVVITVVIQEDTEEVAIMEEVEVPVVTAGTPTAGSIPITTTLRNVIPPIPLIQTASTIKQSWPDP